MGKQLAGHIHAFPWRAEEILETSGLPVIRPMVDVMVTANDLAVTTKALIDTGSPICIFPRGVGDLLAIDFDAHGVATTFNLKGRRWRAVPEEVTLSLSPFDDLAWATRVEIVMDRPATPGDDLPYAILGYEGFLDRWTRVWTFGSGLDRRRPVTWGVGRDRS